MATIKIMGIPIHKSPSNTPSQTKTTANIAGITSGKTRREKNYRSKNSQVLKSPEIKLTILPISLSLAVLWERVEIFLKINVSMHDFISADNYGPLIAQFCLQIVRTKRKTDMRTPKTTPA